MPLRQCGHCLAMAMEETAWPRGVDAARTLEPGLVARPFLCAQCVRELGAWRSDLWGFVWKPKPVASSGAPEVSAPSRGSAGWSKPAPGHRPRPRKKSPRRQPRTADVDVPIGADDLLGPSGPGLVDQTPAGAQNDRERDPF
jgi:hypothetical protein